MSAGGVGAGGTEDESGQINTAQISQFPNFVRAQVLRMLIRRIDVSELEFNPPSEFGTLSSNDVAVFHPSFGTNYVRAPAEIMANDAQGTWSFNMNFEVNNLGSNSTGSFDGNDLMAFLPGIKENICQRTNDLFSLSTIPSINNGTYYTEAIENMDATYVNPASETIIGDANLPELAGQPFGCFLEASNNEHIYFFSIFER